MMKTVREFNEKKIDGVHIDNSLRIYKNMPIFQDKLDRANEVLRTVGIPKSDIKLVFSSTATVVLSLC